MVYIYTAWILGHKPDFSNKVDKATQTERDAFQRDHSDIDFSNKMEQTNTLLMDAINILASIRT